jgi:DNA-binding NtrC family response regulator
MSRSIASRVPRLSAAFIAEITAICELDLGFGLTESRWRSRKPATLRRPPLNNRRERAVLVGVGDRMTLARLSALLLEDSEDDARLISFELEASGFELSCERATNEAEYRRLLATLPDVVIADYTLPSFSATEALRVMRELGLDIPFIVVTGSISDERAALCMREGAVDYLLKDRLARLGPAVRRALQDRARASERRHASGFQFRRVERAGIATGERAHGPIVGESPGLRQVLSLARAVAPTKATVLIVGESGTGKELVAREIHRESERARGPLVKVNCAAIPHELFESEFFGHVKGAFTGAHRNRAGRFELASGGTLFLDEVGEIPLDMQAKLLRVLQENEFERVGDDRTLRVDVRLIAASNRDLEAEVAKGHFRRDLFYRLSVFPIFVPPLRERPEDVLPLARFFLERACAELRRPSLTLEPEHERLLSSHSFPGNIRELEHVISRAVILSRGQRLALEDALSAAPPVLSRSHRGPILTDAALRDLERNNLIAALERSGWRVSGTTGAAELLGLHPSTLRDRMKALGIQRPA